MRALQAALRRRRIQLLGESAGRSRGSTGAPVEAGGITFTWPDVAPGTPANAVTAGQAIAVGIPLQAGKTVDRVTLPNTGGPVK
jgi:hypothetical protein